MPDSMMTYFPIAHLPAELFDHILSFLDIPPPSEERIYGDPADILDDDYMYDVNGGFLLSTFGRPPESLRAKARELDALAGIKPYTPDLKNCSLVCRLWRQAVNPRLFRHVMWQFQTIRRPEPDADFLNGMPEFEWLRFLRRENLLRAPRTLLIVITYPIAAIREAHTHSSLSGILPCHTLPPEDRCNDWLWDTIFANIDPSTISIVAAPAVLAALLGRPIDLVNGWLFQQRFHIVSLSMTAHSRCDAVLPPIPPQSRRPRPPRTQPSGGTVPNPLANPANPAHMDVSPCNLFSIRDWSSLLLNEGSFVKGYATYEYYNLTPPSILHALLDKTEASMTRLLSSLDTLSYIAVFPMSNHIQAALIDKIPRLRHFFIQIVPPQINLAETQYRNPAIDFHDFWVERDSAYSMLAMAIFEMDPVGEWSYLQVFESGDSSDVEAWERAVRFVVNNAGLRWQVYSNGVFVRRPTLSPKPRVAGWLISGH